MAYLGSDGIIKLKRSTPEPIVIPTQSVNTSSGYIVVDYDDWLLAELVTIIHANGTAQGYIFRDELDRIYFHSSQSGALANSVSSRISLSSISTSRPIILAANINSNQAQILITLLGSITSVAYETRLRAWPSALISFKSSATVNPWKIQGNIKRWEFSRSAPEIETGSIGDKFTSFVKSVVSGSGSLDFIISLYTDENESDVDPILRTIQLTEEGSSGTAKFYVKQRGTEDCSYMTRAYYFMATILFTASSINTSFDDVIAGSANFVTTGPIRLLSE